MPSGLYRRWNLHSNGPGGAREATHITAQQAGSEPCRGGNGAAHRRGVARVRGQEHRRALPALDEPGEVHRHLQDEEHIAPRHGSLRLGRRHRGGDVEVVGGPHGRDQRARRARVVAHHQRRRQVLGVGVDGEAEEEELDQRHAHHQGQGEAVPPRLDDLLAQDGDEALERDVHPANLFSESRWMKTSSSEGGSSTQVRPRRSRQRSERLLERGPLGAADPERLAEHRSRLDARRPVERRGSRREPLAGADEGDEPRAGDHLGRGALHHQLATGQVDDAVTALGLVHVVGADQDGDALAGEQRG